MKKRTQLDHQFVEFIPDRLEEGILYVSIAFATSAHKCCCGCGSEVTIPLSPTDWQLMFDGRSVSLQPSIGNWSLACQSHYWIRNDKVVWARQWSKEEIERGRIQDRRAKKVYYDDVAGANSHVDQSRKAEGNKKTGWLSRLKRLFGK